MVRAEMTDEALQEELDRVVGAVRRVRLERQGMPEAAVVAAVEAVLDAAGVSYDREVTVAPGSRVDLLTSGGVAVEVKRGKPNSIKVGMQVTRYADNPNVRAVVLVSERGLVHHVTEAHGKPVRYVALTANWGLSV